MTHSICQHQVNTYCLNEYCKNLKPVKKLFPLALLTGKLSRGNSSHLGGTYPKVLPSWQNEKDDLKLWEKPKQLKVAFAGKESLKLKNKPVKNHLCIEKPIWGALLFSRHSQAFLNLRSLCSTLLKALHVCLFASLNNKRILFVGDSRPLVKEHQHKLQCYFIRCQTKSSSFSHAQHLPTPHELKVALALKDTKAVGHTPKQPLVDILDEAAFPKNKQNKVEDHFKLKSLKVSSGPKPGQKESKTHFGENQFASWSPLRQNEKHFCLNRLQAFSNLNPLEKLWGKPGHLKVDQWRAQCTKKVEEGFLYTQKLNPALESGGTYPEATASLFSKGNKLKSSLKTLPGDKGWISQSETKAASLSIKQTVSPRRFSPLTGALAFVPLDWRSNRRIKAKGPMSRQTKVLFNKTFKERNLNFESKFHQTLAFAQQWGCFAYQNQKLKSFQPETGSPFYIAYAKYVCKAALRNSQWTAALAQVDKSWKAGFFSNSYASYRQNLTFPIKLCFQNFATGVTGEAKSASPPKVAQTINSQKSWLPFSPCFPQFQSESTLSTIQNSPLSAAVYFSAARKKSFGKPSLYSEHKLLKQKGKPSKQSKLYFTGQIPLAKNLLKNQSYIRSKMEESGPTLPWDKAGVKSENHFAKNSLSSEFKKVLTQLCRQAKETNFSFNPWLKEADLVFFANPEKSTTLLSQVNRLRIPSIGIVSSGENIVFPFRSVKGFRVLSSKPTLTYPIIGNANSLNFLRMVYAKFICVLNKKRRLTAVANTLKAS